MGRHSSGPEKAQPRPPRQQRPKPEQPQRGQPQREQPKREQSRTVRTVRSVRTPTSPTAPKPSGHTRPERAERHQPRQQVREQRQPDHKPEAQRPSRSAPRPTQRTVHRPSEHKPRTKARTPQEFLPDGTQSNKAPIEPAHVDSSKEPFTIFQWVLTLFLVIAGIATAIGLTMLWPNGSEPNVSPELAKTNSLPANQVNGTVIIRDSGACNSPSVGRAFDVAPISPLEQQQNKCERAIVTIDSGDNAGKRTLLMVSGKPGEPELHVDDKIRLGETTAADGSHGYTFTDFQRTTPLLLWGALTLLAIVGIGAGRGARSILGLTITLATIAFFLLPALLRGGPPLALAVVCGSAVLFAVLYLVHGLNWKTSSALGGTLISLGISAWLATIAIRGNQLQGLGDDDNILIQLYLPDVTVTGLMLCGFIIGALGVLNDVTIAQASTVNELSEIEPDASPWRLFAGAMKVGRDHIASMVYTLVLSYTGAALPTLLLLSVANRPISQIMFSDVIATELLRSAIGALALSLAVPITTLIAAFTVVGRARN